MGVMGLLIRISLMFWVLNLVVSFLILFDLNSLFGCILGKGIILLFVIIRLGNVVVSDIVFLRVDIGLCWLLFDFMFGWSI